MKSRYETCSKCGAPLPFKGSGEFECEYCGTPYFSGGVVAKKIYSIKKKISSFKNPNLLLIFVSLSSILISYSFFRITLKEQNQVLEIKKFDSNSINEEETNIPIQVEKTNIPSQVEKTNINLFENLFQVKENITEKSNDSDQRQLKTVIRNANNSHTFLMRIPIIRTVTVRVRRTKYVSTRSSTKQIKKDDKSNLYFEKGIGKEKIGDFVGAIEEYDNAIDLNSKDPDYYYYRGWAKARREVRDLKGAISDLQKLNLMEPNKLRNILDLATIYAKAGKFDSAFDQIDEGLKLEPKNGNIFYWKGIYQIMNWNYGAGCSNVRLGKQLNASDYDSTMKRTCN